VRATPLRRRRDQALHLIRRQVDHAIGALASTLAPQLGSHQPPRPPSVHRSSSHEPPVRQLNDALDARRNRIETARGGLPGDITALILFTSFVVVAYAVLVGSPNYWFHLLGPAAIGAVVAVSLVVLVDMSYPFSGDFAIPPDDFTTGALEPFVQ
jgi:hypothetical protein